MAPKVDESISPIGKMASPSVRECDEDDNVATFTCSLFSPRNWGGGNHVDERDDVLSAGPSFSSPISAASLNPINPVHDKHAHGNGLASGEPILSPNEENVDKDNGKKVAFVVKNPTPLSPLSSPPTAGGGDDEGKVTGTLDDENKTSLLSKAKHRGVIGIRAPTPKATGLPPPSPTRTPAVSRPKMVQIPDDESEASLMVLMRYMGCTPKAYGERPHSQLYGCGLHNPTGKEFVCDSEDDQDTLLTDDYETESVISLASIQDPSQSWTKMDDAEDMVGKKKLEKVIKVKDTVKLAKGAKKAIDVGEVANNGSSAIKPTVSSMKYRANLTVDTSTEKETMVTNNAVAKAETLTSPSAISPRSDATSPTLKEAMAAVAAFKKSSVDATSPLSTATLLSHASTAAAKSEIVVPTQNRIVDSSCSPHAATLKSKSSLAVVEKKKKKSKAPMGKDIKSLSVASPKSTTEATVETHKTLSVGGENMKNTITASDTKIISPQVAPSSTISDANTKMSVEGKEIKDTTLADKEVKTPSVAPPSSTSAAIVKSSKSSDKGKKKKADSGKRIETPSLTSPSSTTGAISEASKNGVKGRNAKDSTSSDKKVKSPSVPPLTSDAIVGTKKSMNNQDLENKESFSLVSLASTSTAVDEVSTKSRIQRKTASTKSCVEEKTKKGTASLDKKTKSTSVASPSSTLSAIKESNIKSNTKTIVKKVTGTLDQKTKSSSTAPSSSRESTPIPAVMEAIERINESFMERSDNGYSVAIDKKLASSKKAHLTVNTVCATECGKKSSTQPISPISPSISHVREVDKLLSQTRDWLARHSETQSKKEDSLALTIKKDGEPSLLLNSYSLVHQTAEGKKTLQSMPGTAEETRPVSPPTLSELLHSKKGSSVMSPASPSSPLFALSGSTSFPSSPITGKSIKEQLEEIRAKQRELELRQKAKQGHDP